MARPRANRPRAAAVLTLAVAVGALGLAGSAMPAGKSRPSPAQARPAIDAAGVIETVEHYVDPVVSPEYPVSDPATTFQSGPGIAFDGTNYLAAWYDNDGTSQSLRGGRVSQFGAHLDGMGVGIAPNSYAPSVAFDGTNYLVVWETAGCCGTPQIKGARVNQAGVVLDPAGITITVSNPQTWQVEPSVAFDGTNYLVVWHGEHNWPEGFENIGGRRVSPSGALFDQIEITNRQYQVTPAIAAGGTNMLVVWRDSRPGSEADIYGARVSQAGAVLDPGGIAISTADGYQLSPTLAFDGTNYVVAWEDTYSGSYDIFGARVSPDGTVLDVAGVPIATSPTDETAPAATRAPKIS